MTTLGDAELRRDAAIQAARRKLADGHLAYTIDDLAVRLGVSRSQLYNEIRAGRLKAKKAGLEDADRGGRRSSLPQEAARRWPCRERCVMKRVIPEPLIASTYVELLHHFHGRGYGLKQAIDPRRLGRRASQGAD